MELGCIKTPGLLEYFHNVAHSKNKVTRGLCLTWKARHATKHQKKDKNEERAPF